MATTTLDQAPAALADPVLDPLEADLCAVCADAVPDPLDEHCCPDLGGTVHATCHVRECRDRACWVDTDLGWYAAHE
jgi:hypothetical protein